jgi:hypothetical protein
MLGLILLKANLEWNLNSALDNEVLALAIHLSHFVTSQRVIFPN